MHLSIYESIMTGHLEKCRSGFDMPSSEGEVTPGNHRSNTEIQSAESQLDKST